MTKGEAFEPFLFLILVCIIFVWLLSAVLGSVDRRRSEMTAFFKCDNCNRTIKDTRIHIGEDDQGEPEFLYYFVGDDEGEETDKHYCAKCLAFLLVGHSSQEEVEAEAEAESEEEPEEGEAEK